MAKRLNEDPTIADQIIIDITTPDADGCFTDNPYKVNNVVIYYVERNYSGNNYSSYDNVIYDENLQTQLDAAISVACNDPSSENLAEVDKLRSQLNSSARTETFYYSDAKVVAQFPKDSSESAWLSTDPDSVDNSITLAVDDEGNEVIGHFELEWNPVGLREGDYFVCWSWTPNIAGDSLSSMQFFKLFGNTQLTTSIPTHFTDPDKYTTLLERYLPEMFKLHLGNDDLTPEVLQEFSACIAKGFTFLEDFVNQIVDLVDANAVQESFLPLLGNLFNLKLKTNDPTLWRRQIKQAVPLYKKKGTYSGLSEALEQAGITLSRFARLWQIVSKYTYQEMFNVTDENTFTLSRLAILPIDTDNFELYRRRQEETEWTTFSAAEVSFSNSTGETIMTWNDISNLFEGDEIRVVYQILEVPDVDEQELETYIRELPLSDQRDPRDQTYPIKNWNVRVIEEDDPLFDFVIPSRHPFYDSVIYGKVRTEFPFSENIYNMEEYNGSTRDSSNPCDIDQNFIDVCSSCLSSKFVVDLEIENISNDRITEAQNTILDFVPFHAILHAINLTGTMNEYIQSPVEEITMLVNMVETEYTISGNGQLIFNRSMESSSQLARNELADSATVISSGTGNAYNENMALFSPYYRLDDIGLNKDPDYTFLEILSPSSNAGTYTVREASKNHVFLNTGSPVQTLNQSAFTFRLSNERASKATADIYQDDLFKFTDPNVDFNVLGIKSEWDVENDDDYTGGAWTVTISAYSDVYSIKDVLPDGSLLLDDPDKTLPTSTTSGITYILKNDASVTIKTTSTGKSTISRRGRVDLGSTIVVNGNSVSLTDIRLLMDSYHGNGQNHYLLYDGNQYLFGGFVTGETTQFYIQQYTDGDVGSVPVNLYQRLINNSKGYLHYQGLKLETTINYETNLSICNGENAGTLYADTDASGNPYILQLENNTFYQNFLILIGSDYYAISKIDGTRIFLIGPDQDWTTLGTAVTFDIIQYSKIAISISEREDPETEGHDFEFIDRSGKEIITGISEEGDIIVSLSDESETMILSASLNDEMNEAISQNESITYTIKTR